MREFQNARDSRSVIAGAVKDVLTLAAKVIPMAGVDHIFIAQFGIAAFDLRHHIGGSDFAHLVLCRDGYRGLQRHGLEIA